MFSGVIRHASSSADAHLASFMKKVANCVRVKGYSNRKAREDRKEYSKKLCDLCVLCG
jgi:hypothetical protein